VLLSFAKLRVRSVCTLLGGQFGDMHQCSDEVEYEHPMRLWRSTARGNFVEIRRDGPGVITNEERSVLKGNTELLSTCSLNSRVRGQELVSAKECGYPA
jgi:hypothetical protein